MVELFEPMYNHPGGGPRPTSNQVRCGERCTRKGRFLQPVSGREASPSPERVRRTAVRSAPWSATRPRGFASFERGQLARRRPSRPDRVLRTVGGRARSSPERPAGGPRRRAVASLQRMSLSTPRSSAGESQPLSVRLTPTTVNRENICSGCLSSRLPPGGAAQTRLTSVEVAAAPREHGRSRTPEACRPGPARAPSAPG
jgi:hypothetical protein